MTQSGVGETEPGLQVDARSVDRAWIRIGAGTVIAAQAMVFSLALNLTHADGLDLPRWAVHGLLLASALGALAFLGGDLMRESLGALRRRTVTIDLLFLVTLLGALVGSLIATFRGVGEVYYEVVAILIVVHTVGKMLGARSRLAALRAVEQLRQEFSLCRRLNGDGTESLVAYADLRAGDCVRVLPSELIPVDGRVKKGVSDIQESAMTGEWQPSRRGPGDTVQAGSHALDGELIIETGAGERRIDAVLAAVERAQLAPSEIQAQADRLTRLFLPVVVGAAVATGLGWALYRPWDEALFRAMAVLLVACPCAMGLATPVAIWGALASLARLGLLARTGDFVDGLARVTHVFLDKTGTLSHEELSVNDWRWRSEDAEEQTRIRAAVFALESELSHPVARALAAATMGSPGLTVEGRVLVPGRGVQGVIAGSRWAVGDASLGTGAPGQNVGEKWIHAFRDGAWCASARIGERWRDGLDEALSDLQALGLKVEVLSGDPSAVKTLGRSLPVTAGMTPAAKAERVRATRATGGRVLVVGDGINDAAAMSEADVAIAMRGGTDLARAASSAVLSGARLTLLPRAIAVARRARVAVRRNLIFSFAYNVAGMALAASGHLHPVAAALLMVGSSAVVAWSALRAVTVPAAR
ncbi:heavy metal translocating P-type ATPase [Nibricoccus sp. IMCC34717]|uniref:heavy metal translocating P-type ATPase n=1 Tax=Nibricoccus sp. IMCC34717 TaxID=3034021 RepID=UPI00384FA45E